MMRGDIVGRSQREAEAPSPEDGGGWETYFVGCREIDGGLLSACKAAEEKTGQ